MDTRRFILRLVAGGYVFYLGIQLIQGYLNGNSGMNGAVSIGVGALFLIFGGWSVLSGVIPVVKNGGFATASTDEAEGVEGEDDETESAEDAEVIADGEMKAEEVDNQDSADESEKVDVDEE